MSNVTLDHEWLDARGSDATTSRVPAEVRASHRRSSLFAVWVLGGTSRFGVFPDNLLGQCLLSGKTSAGWPVRKAELPSSARIQQIRHQSGLTWSQLAAIFDVDRRSLHFWVKGERPSSENAVRLERIAAIVKRLDAGNPERTRQRLLEPITEAQSVMDLLIEKRDRDVLDLLAQPRSVRPRGRRRPPTLSPEERQRRNAFTPAELLEARHDDRPGAGRLVGFAPVPSFE
jgi:transcriptional regulator with XRE-family HTH domain